MLFFVVLFLSHVSKFRRSDNFDKPIYNALCAEAYWLYQATSNPPSIKRFARAEAQKVQYDLDNQRNWETMVVNIQDVN